MKKTIRLTLLAVAAVALLTSCDAMLETLFPKDTVGTGSGSNTLAFDISGYDQYNYSNYYGGWAYYNYGYTNGNNLIYVEITAPDGTKTKQTGTLAGYGTRSTTITFSSLTDGAYSFEVWYDVDGDGKPVVESGYYGYYDTNYGYIGTDSYSSVYLPYNGTNTTQSVAVYLSDYPYVY